MKNRLKELWHHLKWHVATYPFFAAVPYLIEVISNGKTTKEATSLVFYGIKAAVVDNPTLIAVPVIAAVCLRQCYKLYKYAARSLNRLALLEQTVRNVGIRSFSHHAEDEKKENWDLCKSELMKSSSHLCIMGAGGYETFSGPGMPLHEFLKTATCAVRILLLDPTSDAFSQRCTTTRTSEEIYRNWIYTSIEYCRELEKKRNASVEIRLYSDYPIWKMIFNEEYMWLQWYAHDKDIHESQVYHLQSAARVNRTSLYYPLASVFQRRWQRGKPVNLSKWRRPIA
jgi:hypothetical protein